MKKMIDKINLLPNYHVLHDSEFPMLMIGKNIFGEYLIASFLEENDELGKLHYFHIFPSNELILRFLKGTVSYLEVMREAKAIFLVEKTYNYTIKKCEKIVFTDLTKDMLPLKSSFFPKQIPSIFKDLEKRISENKFIFQYSKTQITTRLNITYDSSPIGVYLTNKNRSNKNNSHHQNIQKNVYKSNQSS